MRKPMAVLLSLLAMSCLCGSSFAAGSRTLPQRYLPGSLDSGLAVLRGADGATLAVWAYRSGAEYDIAFSRADAGGRWTEPTFIGAGDGVDQLEPAIAVDGDGNTLIAYTDTALGAIRLARLSADGTPAAEPVVVRSRSSRSSFSAAQLTVVGEHVIVAFRDGDRTRMIDLPRIVLVQGGALLTITESGDPVEYRPGTDQPAVEGPVTIGQEGRRAVEIAPNLPKKRYMDNR